jgi:hypothetical protein
MDCRQGREPRIRRFNIFDQISLEIFNKWSFSSVQNLAKMICIPPTTICWQLTNFMSFIVRYLHWVPHKLSPAQLAARAQMSNELLEIIRSAKRQGWQYFITFDKLYFYLSINHEIIWLPEGKTSREIGRHMIQVKNMMFTIAWNFSSFTLSTLSKRKMSNTTCYVKYILQLIFMFHVELWQNHFVIHADNARLDTPRISHLFYESNSLKIVAYSPYSLDLAPSCFFLFDYVKNSMKGDFYASEQAFLLEIHTILREILLAILEAAFKKWMERLILIASHKSHYYVWSKSCLI